NRRYLIHAKSPPWGASGDWRAPWILSAPDERPASRGLHAPAAFAHKLKFSSRGTEVGHRAVSPLLDAHRDGASQGVQHPRAAGLAGQLGLGLVTVAAAPRDLEAVPGLDAVALHVMQHLLGLVLEPQHHQRAAYRH